MRSVGNRFYSEFGGNRIGSATLLRHILFNLNLKYKQNYIIVHTRISKDVFCGPNQILEEKIATDVSTILRLVIWLPPAIWWTISEIVIFMTK